MSQGQRDYLPLIEDHVTGLLASTWVDLDKACADNRLRYPGVYVLAISGRALAGKQIKLSDVLYIGMSAERQGVQQRLRQFKAGIERNCCHSGAKRFYRDHAKGAAFLEAEGQPSILCCCESYSLWTPKSLRLA